MALYEYLGHFLMDKGKKVGGNQPKKVCPKWVTPFLAYPHEKSSKWKRTVSSNDLDVQNFFSFFWRKKLFLAVFMILEKSQKWPKVNFFFWKVEIFLAHLNHLGKLYFLIFYTFLFVKNWVNMKTKTLLCMGIFCHFWPKNAKKINFHEKFLFSDLFYE